MREIAARKRESATRAGPARRRDTKTSSPEKGKKRAAAFIPPMLALGVTNISRNDLQLEIKYDGYRATAVISGGKVELWSRNEKTLTRAYPEVVKGLGELDVKSAVLDGEIVALDPKGRSSFQLMQGLGKTSDRPPIVYYVFDLLQHDGHSLIELPLRERRAALEGLLQESPDHIQISPTFDGSAEELLRQSKKAGLEGIVAKNPESTYESGRRSGSWLKCRVSSEQEFVIGGFTEPKGSRTGFGALLVGYFSGRRLMYAGKVGTGFSARRLEELHTTFSKHLSKESPFANLPIEKRSTYGTGMTRREMKSVTWMKPRLVAQIRFSEWTNDGLLRHPVYIGLRTDKNPREVVREAPAVSV
jgi:bifunctional non-homologous end joining protein LigD